MMRPTGGARADIQEDLHMWLKSEFNSLGLDEKKRAGKQIVY